MFKVRFEGRQEGREKKILFDTEHISLTLSHFTL